MSEIALEKYLGIKFINWEAKSKLRNFPNRLVHENLQIDITPLEFGDYPILIDEEVTLPQIFCIKKGDNAVYICGIATKDILLEHRKDISSLPMALGKKVVFTGVEHLLKFDSIQELEEIVKSSLL